MNIIKSTINNKLFKNVIILASGTAIGQIIAILSMPILTRMYGPEGFSVLAVYVSILTISASVSGLCFEYAIPLPKQDKIAASLCLLALISTFIVSFIFFLLIKIIPQFFSAITNNKIDNYLWLIPIGIFLIGLYNALQYWSTRHKKFGLISKTRVTQSISGTSIKLIFGWINSNSPLGLIIGQIVARGFGFTGLGLSLIRNDLKIFTKLKPKYFRFVINRYINFPKFTTLEVLANNASIQLPIILIAYYSTDNDAGYIMVAMQLLSAPLSMIGSAVSQVYITEGADKYHQGELEQFTKETIQHLAKVSMAPLLILFFIAPWLMGLFLGDDWQKSGVFISWMVPWFFIQFITSPISSVLYITKNQKIALQLQLIGLCLRTITVLLFGIYATNFIGEAYAISGLVFYSIYLAIVLKIIKK